MTESIDDLQTRISFQELEIEALSKALYDNQKRIDQIELQLRDLSQRYKSLQEKMPNEMSADEKPPHY